MPKIGQKISKRKSKERFSPRTTERVERLKSVCSMFELVWAPEDGFVGNLFTDEEKAAMRMRECTTETPKNPAALVLDRMAYQGVVGEFLAAMAEHTEGTDAGVLAHFLPAVATYFGDAPHVWGGGRHPARINTALVGPTSAGRKGSSAMPVKELMKVVDGEFWKSRMLPGGLASGEGVITKVSGKEKRLFVIESEFASVLTKCKREGSILSMTIREAFDSGNLANLTKENSLHTTGAHICVTGHITPEELRTRFSHVEMVNGFGNRFLWFYVKSEKFMPNAPPIPQATLRDFASTIVKARKAAATKGALSLSDKTSKKWVEIYRDFRNERPGMAGIITARGETIVLRLALIYALLDRSKQILIQHLNAAMAVWRYNVQSADLIFDGKSVSTIDDTIYQNLAGGPLNKRAIWTAGNWSAAELDAALERLRDAGRVEQVPPESGKRGRPAEIWRRVNKLN